MRTAVDVKFIDSASLSGSLGDKCLFRSPDLLQIADVVYDVV